MGFFDDAYDNMTWQEVCYRLPSDMAVSALKRRITNLDTLRMFFENVGKQPNSVKELKHHINGVVNNENPDDILDAFAEDYEQTIFNWLDDDNKKKMREHDPSKLSLQFLFNCTKSNDRAGIEELMDKVLQDPEFNNTHLRAVINKADGNFMNVLLDKIVKDSRPEVRVCVLGVRGLSSQSFIGDRYKVIGLKALAKCSAHQPIGSIGLMNVDSFNALKPVERLDALEKYFSYFPRYKKVEAFSPVPAKEEFDMILFSGCLEHNERVNKLNEAYEQITTLDPPEQK